MQSREVQRRDNRGLMIGAGVAIAVILIAATWVLLFANSANSTPSPALSTTTSASRVGMGELRAVDVVNGSQAGMGDIRGVESLRAVGLAMGNLRALEADAAIAA